MTGGMCFRVGERFSAPEKSSALLKRLSSALLKRFSAGIAKSSG
jgi:hypothetical protein